MTLEQLKLKTLNDNPYNNSGLCDALTYDGRNGLQIRYNLLNLPRKVEKENMNSGIIYRYLADGTKESAIDNNGNGYLYRGSFVYSQTTHHWDWGVGEETVTEVEPESVSWKEGRIRIVSSIDSLAVDTLAVEAVGTGIGLMANWDEPEDSLEFINPYAYIDEWHIKDHLGSIRAVAITNGDTSIGSNGVVELNDYLPFGTGIPSGLISEGNRYGFASKERQSIGSLETDYLDFGARHYDPFTARWTTTDPLAEKYHSFSPYNYCAGNPVNLVDPEGMDDYFFNEIGSYSMIGNDDPYDRIIINDMSLLVKDKGIMSGLRHDKKITYTITNSQEVLNVFYFLADNTRVEWIVHNMDNGYSILGTRHNSDSSGFLEDYTTHAENCNNFIVSGSTEVSKIHSHPDVPIKINTELESMGYPNAGGFYGGDWPNYKNDYLRTRGHPVTSDVYFPDSGRIYRMSLNKPFVIRRKK